MAKNTKNAKVVVKEVKKERQAGVQVSEQVQSLLALRKAGIIDRATFRMVARLNNLSCARERITVNGGVDGGHRVPEQLTFLNAAGVEDTARWVKTGSKPAVHFTK